MATIGTPGNEDKGFNWKLGGSASFAAILAAALLYLSATFHINAVANEFNVLVVLLGFSVGWLAGILLSPYSEEEEKKFNQYAKAFGVFASGYLVGKVDKVVEELFKPEFILESTHGFRIMIFVSAVIISFIFTFVFRRYA
jgi:hypothetical protein